MEKLTDKYILKVCKDWCGDWVVKYKSKDVKDYFWNWRRIKTYDSYWNKLVKESFVEKYQAESLALTVLGYTSIKDFHRSQKQRKIDYSKVKKVKRELRKKANKPVIYE